MSNNKTDHPTTIFIVGPTGSGKSNHGMQVAQAYNGEIICADSQTLRKALNLGTAKPSDEDQAKIPHHMIDIIEPYEDFSVAEFTKRANKIIEDIVSRGKLPIIVGGTGLYIDALLYGFSFRASTGDYERQKLDDMNVVQLQEIITANNWQLPGNSQNKRHLIRTIESGGQTSERGEIRPGVIVIGIDPGKEIGEERIAIRIEKMIQAGFVDEVKSIFETYGEPPKKIDAIAYNIALQHRNDWGVFDTDAIKNDVLIAERQYAKRQRSWFKRNNDIVWFNSGEQAFEHIKKMIV